ncbi:MAG: signal peptide peptidase SppA [Phycisphaerales bacterium]|nr:signal peptide peptidase SppA [Phycisphaerales bacterium]MCB9862627.1 signal peptide peptidase SppA [Phycisphaerales bacterium]
MPSSPLIRYLAMLTIVMTCVVTDAVRPQPIAHADDVVKSAPDDDADDSKDADDSDADESKEASKEKKSPIKRLVEIRIDPFLVAARQLNVPLPGRVSTTQELLDRLDKLAKDDEVGGILFDLDGVGLSMPDIEEIRRGVAKFRESGKPVRAFLNSADPNGYMIAAGADEIAMAPCGMIALPGMGRVFPFMRGMYQMQGIEFEVITAGAFKYPGYNTSREPNKYFIQEFEEIMDSWFGDYVKTIADGRHLTEDETKKIIDLALFQPEDAKNRKLVDVIAYYDDYRDRILRREKFKKSDDDRSALSRVTSIQDLLTQITKEMKQAQDKYKEVGPKIAVLHARGPIVDMNLGSGLSSSMIMRDPMVKTIEEIRKNKTIRAVVLHIDSPGGSAYASDIIWKKLRELDEEKPVIACMGSVAASGGYYIAAPARLIYASPSTITGSIGVIAMLQNQASRINRMDVNVYEMKRGERALLGSGHRDMSPEDRKVIQDMILDTYEQFLDRVAEGRKMPKEEIRKLAGGRVYTGRDALKIGLVDRLGGINDAIAAVREMADIPPSAEVKLVHYPRPSSLGELAESLFGLQALMGAAEAANTPAPTIGLDKQFRFFGSHIQPLCWTPIPDMTAIFGEKTDIDAALDLLGIPQPSSNVPAMIP